MVAIGHILYYKSLEAKPSTDKIEISLQWKKTKSGIVHLVLKY